MVYSYKESDTYWLVSLTVIISVVATLYNLKTINVYLFFHFIETSVWIKRVENGKCMKHGKYMREAL